MWDDFVQDLRHGLRRLRRAPGTSTVIVVTLSLALAASVATFSVLNACVIQKLPYREPDRLVFLRHNYSNMTGACSPPTFVDYRRQTRSFQSLSASRPWNANLTGTGEPERIRGLQVSADFFETLGVSAWRGRTFLAAEERPGGDRVVVVSHGLWQRRFGSDPALLGASLRLNGESYAVVGIMPPGFGWGRGWGHEAQGELWAPFALTPARTAEDERGNEYLDVYARLRPGAVLEQAQADIDSTITGLRAQFPGRYTEASGFRVAVVPAQEEIVGPLRPALALVFAAVASLLLVAAANVGGLLLARESERRRETTLRAALGASRARLARQVLAEACVMAAVAGGLGVLLATAAAHLLERIDRVSLPRSQPIAIDGLVAAFAVAATLLVALASGLAPAWQASRADLVTWLRTGPLGAGGREVTRARRMLIVVQTAVAFALLAGAGLIVRSLAELQKVPPGFRTEDLLAVQVQLPSSTYRDPAGRARFLEDVLARASGRPEVLSVAAISELPLGGSANSGSFDVEGAIVPPDQDQPHAELWSVSPGYFDVMGIARRQGRLFDRGDVADRVPVAIVNDALVHRYYPGQDPIGKRISFEGSPGQEQWRQIVGVVGDVRDHRLDRPAEPQIYLPYAQRPERGLSLVVHVAGDALAALPAVRSAVMDVDHDLPLFGVTTMARLVRDDTRDRRTASLALSGFAAGALLLAALGLYGLLAQAVRERAPEIGVRVALGADRGDVIRLVVAEGSQLLLVGLPAGVALATATARLLQRFVFGVTTTDPATYLVVALLLSAVALLASTLPAWRAARLDPMLALRGQ